LDRFDRFDDDARRALTLAQAEAQRFDHNYIGTEHLLLGLLREGAGVAARVLANMGVELAKVRTAVEFIIGRGDGPVVGTVGLTPRAKRVIELAIDEAHSLGHRYVGTEHLLLGLVREGEGIAAGVLASLGVHLDGVRHEVIRTLAQTTVSPTPAGIGSERAWGYTVSDAAEPVVRQQATSGSPFEATIGFSRAVRVGPFVSVSGTAPIWPDGSVDPDPEAQARRCLEIIVKALQDLGAGPEHVIRTRMFITDSAHVAAIGRAHVAVFGDVRPAATMVVTALLDPRWVVEIEADALVL
jgi:enamine deaminase RidA (YjgF/YER057c/UK114 family)